MRGVIDRIEDGIAVILVEENNQEWKIAEEKLPTGAKEGAILKLEMTNDTYTIIGLDEEATNAANNKAQQLQNKLQAKKKRSKFKRR